jgi:hypothetical protein
MTMPIQALGAQQFGEVVVDLLQVRLLESEDAEVAGDRA